MKRVALIGAAVFSVVVVAGGCGSSHNATSLPGLAATKLVRLKAVVRTAAKVNGDTHPSSVMVFATRRHEVPVYLVVVRGQFVCASCSFPVRPPRGNVITVVLDRNALSTLDFHFGGQVVTSADGPGLPLRLGQA